MSDALIFGQYSDGAVISVRRDVSHLPKIYQAAELLRSVGIRVIGAVVNGVQGKADDRITQLRLIAPKSSACWSRRSNRQRNLLLNHLKLSRFTLTAPARPRRAGAVFRFQPTAVTNCSRRHAQRAATRSSRLQPAASSSTFSWVGRFQPVSQALRSWLQAVTADDSLG